MRTITWVLVCLSLAAGLFGAVLFTELGQLMNLPSRWLYALHPHLLWASALIGLIALVVVVQHFRRQLMSRRLLIGYVVVIAGMVFVTNWFVPNVWLRGHHRG